MELIEKIIALVKECGQILLNAERTADMTDVKEGKANFVTVYDKMIQAKLKSGLAEIMPEAVFVGEEGDYQHDISSGYAFIVDPIDGTTNFIKDYKQSVISVGMTLNGESYLGVIYNPYLDEMFYAKKGEGAYLNGKRIHVSDSDLSNGIVLFGSSPYNAELSRKSFDMAYNYCCRALDIRRSGSAALDLCSIAAGRAELYFELIIQPWDYSAGLIIVEEAGGVVTDINGDPIRQGTASSILATNNKFRP